MRTFRLIGMTLLMVMLAVNFTACSDDEDEPTVEISLANLKGTWDMVKCYGWEYNDNNEKKIGKKM